MPWLESSSLPRRLKLLNAKYWLRGRPCALDKLCHIQIAHAQLGETSQPKEYLEVGMVGWRVTMVGGGGKATRGGQKAMLA